MLNVCILNTVLLLYVCPHAGERSNPNRVVWINVMQEAMSRPASALVTKLKLGSAPLSDILTAVPVNCKSSGYAAPSSTYIRDSYQQPLPQLRSGEFG